MIDIKNDFEKAIDTIFDNPEYKDIEIIKRGYAIQNNMCCNSILFIGLNPSFSEGNAGRHFYKLYEDKEYKYFKRFIEMSETLEIPWSHTDMLFCRETSQKAIEHMLKPGVGLSFLWDQLQLSKEIIEASKPKVIVVNNSLARRFLGYHKDSGKKDKQEWLNYDFDFDGEIGTHRIKNNVALENVPVFFSSMLTGQSALDIGSYERLIWQVRRTLIIDGIRELDILKNLKEEIIKAKKFEEGPAIRDKEIRIKEWTSKQKELLNHPLLAKVKSKNLSSRLNTINIMSAKKPTAKIENLPSKNPGKKSGPDRGNYPPKRAGTLAPR